MKQRRKISRLAWVLLLALVFSVGCAEQKKVEKAEPVKVGRKRAIQEPVTLALEFKKGDLAKYLAITEVEKSLDFTGEITKDPQFQSGKTGDRAEMVFSERIKDVDEAGNATAQITIEALKYISKERNVVNLDFDSSREKNKDNELNKLVGQSYTIKISPKGEVLNVSGGEEIKTIVAGNLPSNRIAVNLVSQELIRRRHNTEPLTDANDGRFKVGDKWNGRKKVSFAQMGSEVYDKIYTLKDIKQEGGREIAVVEIKAIPAVKSGQDSSAVVNMFDNVREFEGEMRLDLTGGVIEKSYEKLDSQWVVVDPKTAEEDKELSTIKMGYMQLQSLEKID